MDKIHRISWFGARAGHSVHQLRVMDRHGPFPARWTATGRRYYMEADARRFPGEEVEAPQGLTVVYCRASRRGQGDDLKRQVFLSLMERIEKRTVARLPVAHKDRPTRFGFDRCGHFAGQHGCTITVVNRESLSPREEMVEDPMAVVDAFSGRLHGLHSYRKQIREAVNDG